MQHYKCHNQFCTIFKLSNIIINCAHHGKQKNISTIPGVILAARHGTWLKESQNVSFLTLDGKATFAPKVLADGGYETMDMVSVA